MASAAQKVYDNWEQDENGYSDEYAVGGICQDIASAMELEEYFPVKEILALEPRGNT